MSSLAGLCFSPDSMAPPPNTMDAPGILLFKIAQCKNCKLIIKTIDICRKAVYFAYSEIKLHIMESKYEDKFD